MATKEVVVRVRCSERERTVWGRSADAVGESLSEWIRGRLNSPEIARERVGARAVRSGPSRVQVELLEENDAERFVVPASCPAPNTKKSFKPDFK